MRLVVTTLVQIQIILLQRVFLLVLGLFKQTDLVFLNYVFLLFQIDFSLFEHSFTHIDLVIGTFRPTLRLLFLLRWLLLSLFHLLFAFLVQSVSKSDSVLAPTDPGRFRHGCIDLLKIEFQLNVFLIHIRDHVRWFYERHRERRSYQESWSRVNNLNFDERELPTESVINRERFQFYFILIHTEAAVEFNVVILHFLKRLLSLLGVPLFLSYKSIKN